MIVDKVIPGNTIYVFKGRWVGDGKSGGFMEVSTKAEVEWIPPDKPPSPVLGQVWQVAREEDGKTYKRWNGVAWEELDLAQIVDNLSEALRQIASCESTVKGDVVDIAQKALTEVYGNHVGPFRLS